VSQASNAASVERQQLAQLEVQVAGLVGVMRQILLSVDGTNSSSSGLILPQSPTRSGTPAIKVLSDLVDLVAAELSHKLRGAAAHAATAAQLEAQLASKQDEDAQLQATLRCVSELCPQLTFVSSRSKTAECQCDSIKFPSRCTA
jgi:hypothetical protein